MSSELSDLLKFIQSQPPQPGKGHSAKVGMQLLVGSHSLAIAQLGPDFLLLDQPVTHPPGSALIIMTVDTNERRWHVQLPQGIVAHEKRVTIALLDKPITVIRLYRTALGWGFSLDGTIPATAGYDTVKEATEHAITACVVKGLTPDYALAPADRRVCGTAKVRVFADEASAQRSLSVATTDKPPSSPSDLSPTKIAALANARAKRAIATERTAPEGYRSVEHFIDSLATRCHRPDAVASLARYLDTNPRSVRKWLKKEKVPLQDTLNGMATWLAGRK